MLTARDDSALAVLLPALPEDTEAGLIRAAAWLREQVPALEMHGTDLVGYLRRRLTGVGPSGFRSDLESLVARTKGKRNPGGYLRTALEGGAKRPRRA